MGEYSVRGLLWKRIHNGGNEIDHIPQYFILTINVSVDLLNYFVYYIYMDGILMEEFYNENR